MYNNYYINTTNNNNNNNNNNSERNGRLRMYTPKLAVRRLNCLFLYTMINRQN